MFEKEINFIECAMKTIQFLEKTGTPYHIEDVNLAISLLEHAVIALRETWVMLSE